MPTAAQHGGRRRLRCPARAAPPRSGISRSVPRDGERARPQLDRARGCPRSSSGSAATASMAAWMAGGVVAAVARHQRRHAGGRATRGSGTPPAAVAGVREVGHAVAPARPRRSAGSRSGPGFTHRSLTGPGLARPCPTAPASTWRQVARLTGPGSGTAAASRLFSCGRQPPPPSLGQARRASEPGSDPEGCPADAPRTPRGRARSGPPRHRSRHQDRRARRRPARPSR